MRVLLFRHGAVQHDGEKIFLGRTDLPLSVEGRRQAEAWQRFVAKRAPGSIVASPLSRALEFARIMADDRAADVALCPALAEIDLGDWDGRPMREIQEVDAASWRARGENMARFRPPGGESFADLQNRVWPAFKELTARNVSELIVVSHAGVNRVLLCHLLGMPLANLFRIGQDHACINVIDIGTGGTRLNHINMPLKAYQISVSE